MNFKRGFIAAFIWAVIGIAGPFIAVCVFTVVSWQLNDTSSFFRQDDIAWWLTRAVWPLVGVPIYLGLSALATYTPIQKHRFAGTLAIIFFTAIPLTWILAALELTPQRYKAGDHPEMYFSEFLLLLIPPLTITFVLIALRQTKTPRGF